MPVLCFPLSFLSGPLRFKFLVVAPLYCVFSVAHSSPLTKNALSSKPKSIEPLDLLLTEYECRPISIKPRVTPIIVRSFIPER